MTTVYYPFCVSASGCVDVCSDPREAVKSRALFLLNSAVGERVMRPEWGVDAMEMFYVLEDEQESVREAVIRALSTYIPEMTGVEVTVSPQVKDGVRTLLVEVQYLIEGEMEEDVLMIEMDGIG